MTNITYQVNFCNSINKIKMYYEGPNLEENLLEFDNNNREHIKELYYYGTKLRFESSEDFVFSYSYIDETDKKFNKMGNWKDERVIYKNLSIINVRDSYNNNKVSIKFNSNYKKSYTKYIIVIAPKKESHSIKNFENPCYVTKLATERPKDVKIENIFDAGENTVISTEVDISNIITDKINEYIINIISQELRYDKKLNYYIPISFKYTPKSQENVEPENKNKNRFPALYVILISAGSIILILIIIILIMFIKNKKDYNNLKDEVDKISFIQNKDENDDNDIL